MEQNPSAGEVYKAHQGQKENKKELNNPTLAHLIHRLSTKSSKEWLGSYKNRSFTANIVQSDP